MTREAGDSARLLWRFGRRYAAALRIATLVPIATIALLRVSPERFVPTAAVVAVAAAWTCGYGWWLLAASGRTGPLPVALDTTVLLAASSSVFFTGALEDTNAGWLRLLVTFACVTCQWHTSWAAGAAMAVAVDGGQLAILAVAGANAAAVRALAWALVGAALSRMAWVLVERAARRADRIAAEAERTRREAVVSEAVRAEERELANALHDTAATTLLMVGMGQVSTDSGWLAAQARRDLDRLRSDATQAPERADLMELLRANVEAVQLTADISGPDSLPLPHDLARAIADAAGEALRNARRHAGTDRVALRLSGDAAALRLDIADEGIGFAPAGVPPTRRGLRQSIQDRMRLAGGSATITSAPGRGTLVRLKWPADHD
ncbi:signal transduction histidine kinase [Saccharomonospora amisosensis]|uniref:Signal transduction histidine kinase n=1 Tax=Saccharomonospora amisosensis TaxID=1128677 RepID=A0A7X5US89_9PSEU|nr:ATP-binding protein [Saccharomonospora amisosensis]NIJ13200.1 signal transduction histidine kinase [Saccharomonospora amisosensis]